MITFEQFDNAEPKPSAMLYNSERAARRAFEAAQADARAHLANVLHHLERGDIQFVKELLRC